MNLYQVEDVISDLPQMSDQQMAQAMLDKYGFFVVCPHREVPIGYIFSSFGTEQKMIKAKCVIVGRATLEDFRNQHAIAGRPFKYGGWLLYRAVAE